MTDTGRYKRPTYVTIDNLQREVEMLRGDLVAMRNELAETKQHLAVNDSRFDNGRKVMADIRDSVFRVDAKVEELKPKAPDWQKLLLAGFSIVAVLMGAQLWITEALNERVTHSSMERRLAPVELTQKELSRELKRLAESQSAQAESLEIIKESVGALLERTAPPRSRKRR